jgi:hypothetical protein
MASVFVQRLAPSYHLILESQNAIAVAALSVPETRNRHVLQIRWQEAASLLRSHSFDSIVFDSDPDVPADLGWGSQEVFAWIEPAMKGLCPLLGRRGKFGFIDFSNHVAAQFAFRRVLARMRLSLSVTSQAIEPPQTCRYTRADIATITVVTST